MATYMTLHYTNQHYNIINIVCDTNETNCLLSSVKVTVLKRSPAISLVHLFQGLIFVLVSLQDLCCHQN